MSRQRIAAAGCVLLIALAGWGLWGWLFGDPEMARALDLQQQLASADESMSEEQRRALWGQFREQMDQLSPEQQSQLRDSMRGQFEARMDRRMDEFFALPSGQRVAYLDQQINEMEQRRQQFAGGGGPLAGPRGDRQAGGGRGDRSSLTPAERSQRSKQRLDRSTPDQRAKRSAYFAALNERREQRGLPPFGRGPR